MGRHAKYEGCGEVYHSLELPRLETVCFRLLEMGKQLPLCAGNDGEMTMLTGDIVDTWQCEYCICPADRLEPS